MKLYYFISFSVVAIAAIFMYMRRIKPRKILLFLGVAFVSAVFVGMSFVTPGGVMSTAVDTYDLFDSLTPFGNVKAAEKILSYENLEYPEGSESIYAYLFAPLKNCFLKIFLLDFAFSIVLAAFLPSLIKRIAAVRVFVVLIPLCLVILKTVLYMNRSIYPLNLFDTFEFAVVLIGAFIGLATDYFVFGMSKKEQV